MLTDRRNLNKPNNAKQFAELPEGLRYAAIWYNWIKWDCVVTKNFETWDETLVFRCWLVQTFESMGKPMSIIPMPTKANYISVWFNVNRNLDTQSLTEMEDEFFSIKKKYNGYVAVSDQEELRKKEKRN